MRQYHRALGKYWEAQRDRVLASVGVRAGYYESRAADPFDIDEEIEAYVESVGNLTYEMYTDFAQDGADEAARLTGVKIQWKLEDHPDIKKYLAKDLAQRSKYINETTAADIQRVLREGIEQGEGLSVLRDRIDALYDAYGSRGEMIARTETARAQSSASLEGYRESADEAGVEMMKEWIAELDDRVRDSHAEADGQVVGLDEDFDLGGISTPGPGMSGEPGEDINCRCSVAPVVG